MSPSLGVSELAHMGDLDAVLSKIGDVQVRDPVRQYYRMLYYVQQICCDTNRTVHARG